MRREDLFDAIGMVNEDRLIRCEKLRKPSVTTQRKDIGMHIGKYERTGKTRHIKRVWLIAAIITLMTLLMGSAIVTLISMRTEKTGVVIYHEQTQSDNNDSAMNKDGETTQTTEIHEGEKVVFDEVQDVFVELKPYYPQEVPDGYAMTFVSEGAPLQNQRIDYTNEAGNEIRFWIYIGDPASVIEIFDIENKTDVKINGEKGILYEQTGNTRTLVWTDPKEGFGFALRTADSDVDILAMAESTAEGEYLTPTRSESTVKAVKELGDFYPEYLPDGFVEQGTMGSPIAEGGGWYSYVRKWFVNREENKQIYLEYESYRIVTDNGYSYDPKAACATFMHRNQQGELVAEEIQINGMFGYVRRNHIAWADPDTHVVYHLYSEDISADELLKVALSIYKTE